MVYGETGRFPLSVSRMVSFWCIVFLRRDLNSKIIFVFYHRTKEKHLVNLEPVTTSYLLKSDVIHTHQELIVYVFL